MSKKVQVLIFHCDEKCFMSLVKRMNNKVAPEFGVTQIVSRIHQKNLVEKLLAIAVVGILPFENDLRKGGTVEKVCLTQCGDYVEAAKDSFSCVYSNDGTYDYPRTPENQL